MHNILIFTIEHCVKVRTDCGQDQLVGLCDHHPGLELDITQLTIDSHPVHCRESIHRVALRLS